MRCTAFLRAAAHEPWWCPNYPSPPHPLVLGLSSTSLSCLHLKVQTIRNIRDKQIIITVGRQLYFSLENARYEETQRFPCPSQRGGVMLLTSSHSLNMTSMDLILVLSGEPSDHCLCLRDFVPMHSGFFPSPHVTSFVTFYHSGAGPSC